MEGWYARMERLVEVNVGLLREVSADGGVWRERGRRVKGVFGEIEVEE